MLTREHQLAHELEAVLIDAEKGKFDLTCMNTIRYVAKSLRALSEPAPLEGETPRTAKECIAAVVQELNLDTTDPFTKLLAVACGMQDAHQETKDALLRCQEEVHRLRDECSGLAAGACNVKNGLLAGEGGHAYCRLERELAQMSAQKAEAERRVSELEAKLVESSRDAERLAYLTADHDDAEVRERRNDLLCRMPVMSHSAACADIDIGLAALAAERKEGKHG